MGRRSRGTAPMRAAPPAHTSRASRLGGSSTARAAPAPPTGVMQRSRRGRGYKTPPHPVCRGYGMALSMGVGIVKRGVMGQVLDPSRGLGMTGGWVVVWGRQSRGTAPMRAPTRSYFESLSTSGPCWGWLHAVGGFTVDSKAGMTGGRVGRERKGVGG